MGLISPYSLTIAHRSLSAHAKFFVQGIPNASHPWFETEEEATKALAEWTVGDGPKAITTWHAKLAQAYEWQRVQAAGVSP